MIKNLKMPARFTLNILNFKKFIFPIA